VQSVYQLFASGEFYRQANRLGRIPVAGRKGVATPHQGSLRSGGVIPFLLPEEDKALQVETPGRERGRIVIY
jgi:hypothetical protein